MAFKASVNVALGGGGAKGFAHIGVMESLINNEIEIKSIIGTSIGAIVGALYSCLIANASNGDKNSAQLEALRKLKNICLLKDFSSFKDWSFLGALAAKLFDGKNLESWLRSITSREETQKPFTFLELDFDLIIVATDARSGDEIVYSKQRTPGVCIYEATRASSSLPFLFREKILVDHNNTPIKTWDGGLVGNCRFDLPLRSDPFNKTVASSLTYRSGSFEATSGFIDWVMQSVPYTRIALHTMDIMMLHLEENVRKNLTKEQEANLVMVKPDYGGVKTSDFGLSPQAKRDLIENGRLAMELKTKELFQRRTT